MLARARCVWQNDGGMFGARLFPNADSAPGVSALRGGSSLPHSLRPMPGFNLLQMAWILRIDITTSTSPRVIRASNRSASFPISILSVSTSPIRRFQAFPRPIRAPIFSSEPDRLALALSSGAFAGSIFLWHSSTPVPYEKAVCCIMKADTSPGFRGSKKGRISVPHMRERIAIHIYIYGSPKLG